MKIGDLVKQKWDDVIGLVISLDKPGYSGPREMCLVHWLETYGQVTYWEYCDCLEVMNENR